MSNTGIYRLNLGQLLSFFFSLSFLAALPTSAHFVPEYQKEQEQLAQAIEEPEEINGDLTPEDLSEPDETRSLVLSDSVLSLPALEHHVGE